MTVFLRLFYLSPLLLFSIVQAVHADRIPVHIPALLSLAAFRFIADSASGKKMSGPASYLLGGELHLVFVTFLILLFPMTPARVDVLINLSFYTVVYSLFVFAYTVLEEGEFVMDIPPGWTGVLLVKSRVLGNYMMRVILWIILLFAVIHWKLGNIADFSLNADAFLDALYFAPLFLAPKLFFWVVATAVGMIIFLKLILKQGEDSDALLHNFLIFQMRLTALVLGFQALILSMSTVAERRTLLFVFVSVIVFITAVWFLASVIRLLPLSKQPDDVVAFRTAQLPGSKFQRLYFIFASLLPSGMVYYAGNLTAALVFYIILLLAGHIFLYRD